MKKFTRLFFTLFIISTSSNSYCSDNNILHSNAVAVVGGVVMGIGITAIIVAEVVTYKITSAISPDDKALLRTCGVTISKKGRFVASMQDYTITSTDGINWTWAEKIYNPEGINGVTVNGSGTFVVVGDLGRILTSPNGRTWNEVNSGIKE